MSRRSTPSCADGATLVEVLVALAVVLAVTGAAYSMSLSSRRLYDADRARTRLNQSLRAGVEFLTADIRQAGERLGDDFPAIEIVDGASGPDRLVVRRNLVDTVFRLCRDVDGSQTEIYIGEPDDEPPPGCAAVADADDDGWPDNLQRWRERRLSLGGVIRGYIYDPSTRQGQFFDVVDEDADRLAVIADAGTTWERTYRHADQARLYVLEERRYEIEDRMLSLTVDADGSPIRLVDGIDDFQARVVLPDGTVVNALGPGDVWFDLEAIEVDMVGSEPVRGRTIRREWSTRILPRNVISR